MRDRKLEFKDAPMFGRVMRDPEICKGVLERILDIEIDHIEYLNAEQAFDPATDAKGVRLDVFAKVSGRVFDVEMQVARKYDLGKRMRYYQALIDQACLERGDEYDTLAESYIIFVCDFDPYDVGSPSYRLERTCQEHEGVRVGDDSHWLVLNACAWEAEADPQRARLLEYVHTSVTTGDGFIRRIEEAVVRANTDAAWRENAMGFMTVEHDHHVQLRGARKEGFEEGVRQGLERGLEQGREEAARYAALVDALLDAGRIDDLKRSAEDEGYRQVLLEEFRLS